MQNKFKETHDVFQKYYHLEKEKLRRMNKSQEMWFIVKPDEGEWKSMLFWRKIDSGAQGTGIFLIQDPADIKNPQQKQLIQARISFLEYVFLSILNTNYMD